MSNDLRECIKLFKMTSIVRAMKKEPKESNLFILPPVEYREELMLPESTEALIRMWGPSEFGNSVKYDDGRYYHDKFSDICFPI